MTKLIASSAALCMLIGFAAQPTDSQSGNAGDNVLPPLGHTFFCMRYPNDCTQTDSTGALPGSVDGRWHKMNLVNASVNAAITPKSDPDELHWMIDPLQGDCNDFSVTKRHELLNAGWPSSSLLLAEVILTSTGEHHLILIVTGDQANWVLDNLNHAIVTLAATQKEYTLVRVESSENPQFWTKTGSSRLLPGGL